MEHILIIDDDPAVRNVFTQLLESKNYSVETAGEGKEGLNRMKSRLPDLIITDIMMPEMDGLELVQTIRQISPDLPIIANLWRHANRRNELSATGRKVRRVQGV